MNQSNITPDMPVKDLASWYEAYCRQRGLRESSVKLYMKICPSFVRGLSDAGAAAVSDIKAPHIIKASLSFKSGYYLSAIHTFLNALAENSLTDRNYAYILPYFKRPQPVPSVYSSEEILRIEAAVKTSGSCRKRNYAMLLLATRLGIRAGDISRMNFNNLDFKSGTINLTQQKTAVPLCLPMLPGIKAALVDYIDNERAASDCPYVFLCIKPPYKNISVQSIWKFTARAIKASGIETAGRKTGAHAFRSSLASSMINDNIPYEAVRKVLGHNEQNAIKSYARLDTEQLRIYALDVPPAVGAFADFLSGRFGL